MKQAFIETLKNRRTHYQISNQISCTDEQLVELIQEVVKHTPAAFNSQSSRVIVLIGEQHKKLWNIVEETLRKLVSPDKFSPTEEKIASFRAGYGSLLFFEDQIVVEKLQQQFPLYKENFPTFSSHSSGMVQHAMWVALAEQEIGASLQHYNPVIDDSVHLEWNIPSDWKLIAQMPFGIPTAPAGEKEFLPIDSRVKVYK